jgi:hypothetical protein
MAKLSAYNRFVQRQAKAGKSFKQIGRMWDKKKGKPKSSKGNSTSGRNTGNSQSKPGGSRRMGDPLSANKLMSWGRKGAILAPAVFTLLEQGLTPAAGKEIVRKYTGYDGGPIRSMQDVLRVAGNLLEGYGAYGVTKVGTTVIQRGSAMLARFLGGR